MLFTHLLPAPVLATIPTSMKEQVIEESEKKEEEDAVNNHSKPQMDKDNPEMNNSQEKVVEKAPPPSNNISSEPIVENTTENNPVETTTDLNEETKPLSKQAEITVEEKLAPPVPTDNPEGTITEEDLDEPTNVEEDPNENPLLLITEIIPDNTGADRFEFFEVFNNSNLPISLDYVDIYLRSTDSSYNDRAFTYSNKTIQPGEVLVFWNNSNGLELEDFNEHYSTQLDESKVVEYEGTSFSNQGNRGVVIKENGTDIVVASYATADFQVGKSVTYQYQAQQKEMLVYEQSTNPTPGEITSDQIPENNVVIAAHEAPVIEHEPVVSALEGEEIIIQANLTDDEEKIKGFLYYRQSKDQSFQVTSFDHKESNIYEAVIPGQNVKAGELEYYMEAVDWNYRTTYPEASIRIQIEAKELSEEDYQSIPPLLITELAPNSKGPGTDFYEYFEIYNNSNQPLSLRQYAHIYYYTDSGRELLFQVPNVTIEPKETLVFWYNNGNNTLEDFNAEFSVNLTEDQVVQVTDSVFPGFANGGNRALVLKNAQGEEVVYADYDGADNDNNGKTIHYQYPLNDTKMKKYKTLATPTPGEIETSQVPKEVVQLPEQETDTEAPKIVHEPVTSTELYQSISIEAEITDDITIPTATLYVKEDAGDDYRTLTMRNTADSPSIFTAVIPGEFVASDLTYYIEASDGFNSSTTEPVTISTKTLDIDTQQLPKLLVTEVVPDSTNVGSADGYEFIEVYNNTDQPTSLEHYTIQYRYGNDPASDVLWPAVPYNVVIPARETLVFWIINGQNNDSTVADFNENYGSNLVENKDIVRIYSAGMANGSMRGLIIASNIGKEYSIAYYNDDESVSDTAPDKGIIYKFPTDDSNIMEKMSAGVQDATPGRVETYQVPSEPVRITQDSNPPSIQDRTSITTIQQTEDLDLKAYAADEEELLSVAVHYRTDKMEEFQTALLHQLETEGEFSHRIYSPEIIGATEIEYYFEASDGTHTTTTDRVIVSVESNVSNESLRLNVEQNQVIGGTYTLKGTSNNDRPSDLQMRVDGEEFKNTFYALEHPAYFAYEVSGINTYFQNGVTIGDQIIHIFDDWMAEWETISVPIEPELLSIGSNTITIRAGNKASPWEGDPGENRDDYNLRNVRLVLADGTVLYDPNKADPTVVYDMGDDGTYRIFEDFTFQITDEHTNSIAYVWDTKELEDGEYVLELEGSHQTLSEVVMVDNTAPTIEFNIEDGEFYKGTFVIDAEIIDEVAGVMEYEATLNGEQIELPYATSSGTLKPGEHTVTITAIDHVGNESVQELHFTTADEHPVISDQLTDAEKGDPTLRLLVNDPMEDNVHVSFYQAYQYKPSDMAYVQSYQGAAPTEPPATLELGVEDRIFTEEETSLTSEQDGEYLMTRDTENFPYHRFDITLDDSIQAEDTVELEWTGHSLEGRKVSMYVWNFSRSQWDLVAYEIAGENDFILRGEMLVGDYSENHKIHALVQDEIPEDRDAYDYTFVWMSDTQYYAESYPHIFDRQTEWIAAQKNEMKIEYVIHSGDLVDESDQEYQWIHADEYMGTLDKAGIPYGVLAGNHDVYQKDNDYTEYYKYFGEERFNQYSYYGGSYLNNRGHYDLISAAGNDYIFVYLGWGIEDDGITWMNEVLAQHPDRTGILVFHEYLQATGTRHPLGEKLYQEVVLPNENVIAVLSGHYHEAQTLIDEIDDDGDGVVDRRVYQMLADYQAGPEGGQGYMRLLHFDTSNNQIYVNTYSPYLDDYNYYDTDQYPGKDEFTIDLDLTPKEKLVATDSFTVNVYTNNEIDTVYNVPSGGIAETIWEGLTEDGRYFWYATLTDEYSGETRSSIWSLVRGEDSISEGDMEDEPYNPELKIPNPADEPVGDTPRIPGNEEPTTDQTVEIDKVSSTGVEQSTEDDSNNEAEGQTSNKKLPKTATNIYHYLFLSAIFIAVGLLLYVLAIYRKRVNN